ncbi:MAG: sigma-70 family RNA polymerase sigma factor [Negativicutes bacterium]|nr:sigma-70 family RNA polymerase sigma factor [Negativicutes bacterium]
MTQEEATALARLVLAAQRKDEAAFEQLVHLYEKKVYRLAYRMADNPDDALEMTQEIFLKLYRSLNSFKGESTFNTWFYRLAVNACLDFLRKRQRVEKVASFSLNQKDIFEKETEPSDAAPLPQELLERADLQFLVQEALKLLNPDQKIILILCDIENRSYEEIAELLQCKLGTVKSRISRARCALRQIIIDQAELFQGYLRHTDQKGGSE